MEKVSWWRRARPLAGALGLICLAAAAARPSGRPGQARPGPRPSVSDQSGRPSGEPQGRSRPWWEVGVIVSVKGEYAVRGAEAPYAGSYSFRARWTGRLELDGDDDFLLVHLGTEVLDWSLREKARKSGRESVLEAAEGPKPALRMGYLIKDGTEVEFVFGLGGVAIPLHAPELGLALELPRTSARQPGLPGRGYGDFVRRGSCRVAVPEKDFVAQPPERRFAWDWEREREFVRDGRTLTVAQSHTVETVVVLVVH